MLYYSINRNIEEIDKLPTVKELGTGREADIYVDDDNIVYKLFKNELTGFESAKIEDCVLKFLNLKSFPVPTSKGLFRNGKRFGIRMGFVNEKTLQDDFYEPGHGKTVGEILGELHFRLHQIDISNLDDSLPHASSKFENKAKALDPPVDFSSMVERKLVLAHGDFHPANIIEGPQSNTVIDWSRSFVGPAEADIAITVVLFKIFQIPPEISNEMRTILNDNLIEALRTYLSVLDTHERLNRPLIEQWIRVVPSQYLSSIQGINEIVQGMDDIPWPPNVY